MAPADGNSSFTIKFKIIVMKKSFLILIAAALILQSCAKVFYTTDAVSIAASHNLIAIVPPKVSIDARKNVAPEAMSEQQKSESVNFQKEMYSWLLKRKMQGKIFVDVQDVETTNAILASEGLSDVSVLTPAELSDILKVDGVITSNFSLSRPLSTGAAIALIALTGLWGPTNEAAVSLSIHDRFSGKMIWNYNHRMSSTLGTPARLVDDLMRHASTKMPYFNGGSELRHIAMRNNSSRHQ